VTADADDGGARAGDRGRADGAGAQSGDSDPTPVAALPRHGGELLVVRRARAERWNAVRATPDPGEDPAAAARRAVADAVGIGDATAVRAGDPVAVGGTGGRGDGRTVRPVLLESPTRAVDPAAGIAAAEWLSPPALLDRATPPGLWRAYRAVGPTPATVAADREHGAAWLSVRALGALRDAAAAATRDGDGIGAVAAVARDLRDARPAMAAPANRVNRVMSRAARTPAAVRDRAVEAVEAALAADEGAAARAAGLLDDAGPGPVVTLSRSGTVRRALEAAGRPVVVGVSRPGGEGRATAAALAAAGLDVTLVPDAALPGRVAGAAAALVGADAVEPDGAVVNKVGTRPLALAADRAGVPLYVAAARDKVAPGDGGDGSGGGGGDGDGNDRRTEEAGSAADAADGGDVDGDGGPDWPPEGAPDGVTVEGAPFERTPAALVTGVATEAGLLDPDGVRAVAAEHREHAAWDRNWSGDGETGAGEAGDRRG